MSFLVKEYEIPFLGKIELIEATGYDKSFNGKYYASNKQLGEGFCKNCKTLGELKEKVNEDIIQYFSIRKSISELTIKNEEKNINKLELQMGESKQKNWFEKYQTENPLQLEKQEERKK